VPCPRDQYSFDSKSCALCPSLPDGIENVGGCAFLSNDLATDVIIPPAFWPDVESSIQGNSDLLPCDFPSGCATSICKQVEILIDSSEESHSLAFFLRCVLLKSNNVG